jgi:RNA polymerase sigma-70 factor (ECF subfamily)
VSDAPTPDDTGPPGPASDAAEPAAAGSATDAGSGASSVRRDAAADVRLANLLAVWADTAATRAAREDAFAMLVEELTPRVFAVCHRELRNAADAEEATQDTFAKLARAADTFRGDSKVSTFVYRIAVNACRDIQRRLGRRPQHPVADIEVAARRRVDGTDRVADVAVGFEETDRLARAMAELDDLSRTLLLLCAVEGLTYPEASQALDIPVGTIKSRVFRARARLAELLDDDGGAA